MGVIRKNNTSRDAGTKYNCDVCGADITATVRISCAEAECPDYDLCVSCFLQGDKSQKHDPQTHRYRVIEQNSIPIYTADWGADEELALIEGAEKYGLGSWADIAEHIGGYRTKDEVRDHYIETYIVDTSHFPLPERADPNDKRLFDEIPKEEFQARKKQRIEERKEAAKSAPAAAPKQKPAASVPSCHEVQGFMPGRLEFETEFANDAEEGVQHMQFEPGDGIDPATGELTPEAQLKMVIFDIYNTKLHSRHERKEILFEHELLNYKKNIAIDKRRTKEERELYNKAKPFAKMMNHEDFEEFTKDLLLEHNLRAAIAQLQEWRNMGVTDLKDGERYEAEKLARAQRAAPQGAFDRLASIQRRSNQHQPDHPTEVSKLTGPDLPHRFQRPSQGGPQFSDEQPAELNDFDKIFAETSTGALSPPAARLRTRYVVQPLNGVTPWKLEEESPPAPDLQLLSRDEIQLCNALHMRPKPYLVLKEALLREALRNSGNLKKKDCRAICRVRTCSARECS